MDFVKIFEDLGNTVYFFHQKYEYSCNIYIYSLENNQNQIITRINFQKQCYAKSTQDFHNFLILQLEG